MEKVIHFAQPVTSTTIIISSVVIFITIIAFKFLKNFPNITKNFSYVKSNHYRHVPGKKSLKSILAVIMFFAILLFVFDL